MVTTTAKQFIWTEKYRPMSIADCILPSSLKKTFSDMLEHQKELQGMLLIGPAGCGKTTVARALCEEKNVDMLFINGSESGDIGTLRTRIRQFASTVSLTNSKKVVILDEADGLNPNSTQPALRGFIEEFAANCRFILTANFRNKIIEPLQSRNAVVEFKIPSKEYAPMAGAIMDRLKEILEAEGVKYSNDVLAELVKKHFPDFRRMLNELQRYSVSGVIDAGMLSDMSDINLDNLVSHLKAKDFTKMRVWVAQNIDMDPIRFFRKLYDSMYTCVEKSDIPKLVVLIAEYQYKAAFVADHEINLVAFLTECMVEVKFK